MGGFNFTVVHRKERENINADTALSRPTHMADPPQLEDNEYIEFYEVNKRVICIADSVSSISYVQSRAAGGGP